MRTRSFVAALAALLFALTCALAPAATALEEADWASAALFAQMTGGISIDTSGPSFNFGERAFMGGLDDTGGALRLSIGLRPYKWFALGFAYEYQSGLEKQEADLWLGTSRTVNQSNNTVTGQAKVYAPFGFIHPFVLGGVGATFQSRTPVLGLVESEQLGVAQAGGGLDIFITPSLVVVIDTITTFSLGGRFDSQRFTTVGMGVKYRYR
jgi:opacity protein-like surface antigen